MTVDIHTHLTHPEPARTEYDTHAIVGTTDGVGCDKSVVFATCSSLQRSIEMARRAREAFPDRPIPVAYGLLNFRRAEVWQLSVEASTTQICNAAAPALLWPPNPEGAWLPRG